MNIENLYNKIKQLQEDYETVIMQNNGEITPEADDIEKQMDLLIQSEAENVDSLYFLKESLESDITKLLDFKTQIMNLIANKSNRLDYIKNVIAKVMNQNGKEKLVGTLCSISKRLQTNVKILDKDIIPNDYKKITYTINNTLLKKELEEGKAIDGVSLEKTETVTFYKRGKK